MSDRPTALVTGASRGIGAAIATALADTHDLLLGGRDEARLADLAAGFPSAQPWPVELTDESAVAAATAGIDRLDVLVHSAGIVRLGAVADLPASAWRESYEVNVVAVAELTRRLLPALRTAGGHVVLINSGAGLKASPRWGAYATTKFALRAFADVLRAEEPDLRVTSVHPGRTTTDMQREVREFEQGDFEPTRYLTPESVAGAVHAAITTPADAQVHEVVIRPRA
ncbi:short chain dehydrogenase [Actinophytocola xinjiangensis]|jgi:NADP-dependent 3-hydroxy acid dehydrogenase YdfG|uniref:Short chain dehydrogenase n=1 Tax=Actinophytocola xinjiangensis TaxID=485602 RepID=A0A7Z0WG01_9PSEU|nr:SDR family oxidoreductase [Actinophytocola xinjiangensis]OLF04562.1 short chain dehydrogenase [Actinophytocola xinjiangensis]